MKTVLLGDVCEKVTSGGTPLTTHPEYYGGDIPWLRTQEVNFSRIYSTEKTITEEGLKHSSAKLIPQDSVIVAMYGVTAGKSAINKIPLTTNQACCNLIIDSGKADFRYIYYALVNDYERLLGSAIGAAQQNLSVSRIVKHKILLPDIDSQQAVADFLSSIDEKIELNQRMNETLEQIGQTLFKRYFIDSSESKNWPKGMVEDLARVLSGFAFKGSSFDADGKFGLVTIKNVQDGLFVAACTDFLKDLPANMPDYCNLVSGDILLSLTGNVGRVCSVTGKNLVLNQRVAKLEPTPQSNKAFVYLMFRRPEFKDTLISISRGTAQMNLSPVETKKLPFLIPPESLIREFGELASGLYQNLVENNAQNVGLIELRDSLLPRLVSRKIKV